MMTIGQFVDSNLKINSKEELHERELLSENFRAAFEKVMPRKDESDEIDYEEVGSIIGDSLVEFLSKGKLGVPAFDYAAFLNELKLSVNSFMKEKSVMYSFLKGMVMKPQVVSLLMGVMNKERHNG